jgi:probable rRNA maturation factor
MVPLHSSLGDRVRLSLKKKLNKKMRQANYATDILSFCGDEGDSFGELVICPQVLKKQAKEHGFSFQHELIYMLIHGVLHLLGYDHEQHQRKASEMFRIQDKIFQNYIQFKG